ncbi:MAG: hypothetical protein N2652_00785 [Kiritimatiellae bacterium]|nr:hypothetical protein [Kiritimatiellia bacterium]
MIARFLLLAVAAVGSSAEMSVPVRQFQQRPAIRLIAASGQFRFDGGDAVDLWLDAATLGAVAMADAVTELPASVAAARLPLPEVGSVGEPGTLRADWSPSERKIAFYVGTIPLVTNEVPEGIASGRLLLWHLDRLALLALPKTGGRAIWIWSGGVRFLLQLPDAEQYFLCSLQEAMLGGRPVEKTDLLGGISLERLDAAGDVTVSGISPKGQPFRHRHLIDSRDLEARVQRALIALNRGLKVRVPAPARLSEGNVR